jgi:4-hydroxy-tetrahydrodipicolinate reductase
MDVMKIGVVGCAGRMGRMIMRCIHETTGAELAGGTEAPGAPALGRDLGELAGLGALGLAAADDPVALFARSEAVIDFTAPAVSVAHAELAAQAQAAHVIGTTGLDPAQQEAIARAARHTAVVLAPNMSLGVTLLTALVEQVARTLDADYDIEVVEMHHRRKVDAPSGTALALGRAAAAGRQVIGFATLRGGDVVGDHTVVFAAEGERLELTHKASTREVFARGAIKAALWARGKPPGLYSMRNVLGLA